MDVQRNSQTVVRVLGSSEAAILSQVRPGVFDKPIDARLRAEFFNDARHHLAVAIDDGWVVGMASAVHYVNPDKPPELWINEVAVAPTHRKLGLGKRLLAALKDHGRALGCRNAWVLTDQANSAAMHLYAAAGGIEEPKPSVMFMFPLDGH